MRRGPGESVVHGPRTSSLRHWIVFIFQQKNRIVLNHFEKVLYEYKLFLLFIVNCEN